MRLSLRFGSLLVVLAACPGNPLEADNGTIGGDTSSGSTMGDSLTSSATLTTTGGMSATMSSDSDDSTLGPTTSPTTTDATTTDPDSTGPTTDPTTTDATTDPTTTDPTTTDPTTTDASTSTETGEACVGDEPAHATSGTAIALTDNDCDTAPGTGDGIIDAASSPDWWSFGAGDVNGKGSCEPEVRIEVTAAVPLQVCAYSTCLVGCTMGMADGLMGCCNTDRVEFTVECVGNDDSSTVTFSVGEGGETCVPYSFEYEA